MLNGSLWGVAHVLFSVKKFEIMHQSHPNKFMLTYVPSFPTPKNKKKGLFVPADFLDESFSDDLEGDIASECGKCGQIEKITVFSKNPRGVVIVKFNTSYASQECVKLMDGRFFGGKKLRCYFWDGSTNFTGLPCNGWLRMLLRLYYFILPTRFFQPFSPLFYSAADLTFL